jgi:plastocyanin
MRLTKLIVLLVVAALGLAACSSKKTTTKSTTTTLGTTSTSSTSAYSSGGATSSTSGATPASATVEATEFKFTPAIVNVKAGDNVTLTFKNAGRVEHNFSITPLSVSQDAEKGSTHAVQFTAPSAAGDVQFFCKYHKASSNMVGTLHVT